MQVIAHRGGAALRPENTLAAFEHAAALGADILEMDLRVAADGAFVVIHDATLERTTDGRGAVGDHALAALRQLDAGYRFSPDGGKTFPWRGKGVRIPSFEEVLASVPDTRLVVEMKQFSREESGRLCALVRRTGAERRVLVASFANDALRAFRAACPEVATSMSALEARIYAALLGYYVPPVVALQVPDRLRERQIVTPELLATARGNQLKLHAWTVNDEARLRELVKMGVDGIMTDRPDLLLRVRALTPNS